MVTFESSVVVDRDRLFVRPVSIVVAHGDVHRIVVRCEVLDHTLRDGERNFPAPAAEGGPNGSPASADFGAQGEPSLEPQAGAKLRRAECRTRRDRQAGSLARIVSCGRRPAKSWSRRSRER